jgi:tight adherence protein C
VTAVIVLGVLLALGLLQLRWLVFPPTPDLVAEIEQWRRGRALATRRAGSPEPVSPMGRLTRWVSETLDTYRPGFLTGLAPDLALTRRDLQTWLGRVTGLALVFGLGPAVLMLARRLGGDDVSLQWAPVVGLGLAVAAVVLSVKDLRSEASRLREQFTWGLSIYLDLVAMSMEAGQGHAQALPAAAQMGTARAGAGRVFTEIRTAIELAPSKGITAWEALGQLGRRYQIPELVSLRSSMELAQDDGARVKASLIARADTMRTARLAATVERANNATESMRQLTMLAAMLAAIYIAAPYILALRTAAGVPG